MTTASMVYDFLTEDYRSMLYAAAFVPGWLMASRVRPRMQLHYGSSTRMKAIGDFSIVSFFASMLVFFGSTVASLIDVNSAIDAKMSFATSILIGVFFVGTIFSQCGTQGTTRRSLREVSLGLRIFFVAAAAACLIPGILYIQTQHHPFFLHILNMPTMYMIAFLPVLFTRLFLRLASAVK